MLEIGSVIDGKYKILNVVGKGGMSVVYLAMNERANKQWAIKEIRKDGIQNFEIVKQNLVAETDLLKRLEHPNLPSIIDVIDSDGTFLIVMDYIEGKALDKILETTGAQKQADVIEWSKQLCRVLGYLHSQNPPIIYRDMKPANVMLKPEGDVILIDFGTAREFKEHSNDDTTCLGTQGYAAPEQYGGHGQTDARTDVYCLGATMYHLVTGHNPSREPYEMYPIRQWNPMLSSGLEEIIQKCTQKNPNDRYQSCEELFYDLENYTYWDIKAKKQRSLRWRMFLSALISAFVFLSASLGFNIVINRQTKSMYTSYVNQGTVSTDVAKSAEYFAKAIELIPQDYKAYDSLLTLLTKDDVFTADSYDMLKKSTEKYRDILKASDSSNYVEKFAYPLAQALYFMYDSAGGINQSIYWFKEALDNTVDEHIAARSALLGKMAEYHSTLSVIGKNGDATVSYREYWDDLKQMASEELISTENIQNTLSVYKCFVNEMYTRAENFDFLTEDDIKYELNRISSYINRVKQRGDYMESLYGNLLGEINSAADKVKKFVLKAD